ncbi:MULTISPECIES: signal peptidase I [unclassified Crossiella]|uniref:signal peptidase I n=1 Tax=unclassified Crossiella TaxID=2620835 RepID=UPI001FFE9399|nr:MULTISPECIES: signal peptidase I [unclassified Crossiella]MCK2245337.1 signal peptidase I [Crossiella sp. S99.2]MCK2258961.1 signal peptidase I [Crossiella sp. S99.1]
MTGNEDESGPVRAGWRLPLVICVLGLVLAFVGIGVLTNRYDRFRVETSSMENTLAAGKRAITRPVTDGGVSVQRGDVVVFDPNESGWPGREPGAQLVKRVVGIGGDSVTCCDLDGRLQVNGRTITETYLRTDDPVTGGKHQPQRFTVRVPQDRMLLLGDYRGNSRDSRAYLDNEFKGSVPRSAIKAVVVAVVTPGEGVRQVSPSLVFTDAGLAGAAATDYGYRYAFWTIVTGALLVIITLLWLAVVGALAWRRRRRQPVLSP